MSKHVIHKHSSQVLEEGAKLISPSDIEYGELALNYSKGYETLMFKNSQDEIVTMALSDIGGGGVGMSDPNSPFMLKVWQQAHMEIILMLKATLHLQMEI